MDRLDTSNTNAPHLDKVQISHFPPPPLPGHERRRSYACGLLEENGDVEVPNWSAHNLKGFCIDKNLKETSKCIASGIQTSVL